MDRSKAVGFQTRKLANVFRRAMDCSAVKKHADTLTGVHGWILGYLYDRELEGKNVYQKDLEQDFGIRRSTVTQMMQLMEKNGLITRECVSLDARLKRLVLTDKGKEIHLLVVRDIQSLEDAAVKGISQDEINAFLTTAEKIKSNVNAYIELMDQKKEGD